MEDDLDRLKVFEAALVECLSQELTAVGADIDLAKKSSIQPFVPFQRDGTSLGLAVILVGMVPSRWLVAVTGKTIHDPLGDRDISWLRPVVASAVSRLCGSPVCWYASLEDVPMAGSD